VNKVLCERSRKRTNKHNPENSVSLRQYGNTNNKLVTGIRGNDIPVYVNAFIYLYDDDFIFASITVLCFRWLCCVCAEIRCSLKFDSLRNKHLQSVWILCACCAISTRH